MWLLPDEISLLLPHKQWIPYESFSKFFQINVISGFLVNIAIKIVLFWARVFNNNQEMRKDMKVWLKIDVNTENKTSNMTKRWKIACDFAKRMHSNVIIDAVDIIGSAKTHLMVCLC